MKKCIVCMVQNSLQYIGVFIEHHAQLVDHIYLIDHRSKTDLSAIDYPGVTVIKSKQVAQFQSECTNLVIQHFKLWEHYDWVFVLDIDEFLPFDQRVTIDNFLFKHRGSCALKFEWLNGVAIYPSKSGGHNKTLGDCEKLTFHKFTNPTVKVCANARKLGNNFLFRTGAHQLACIKPTLFSRLLFRKNIKVYLPVASKKPLYHVVSFDKESFVSKIQNYIRQMEMRSHVLGQGGWMVRDYPDVLSDEEWLWYIANFRVANKKLHYPARVDDFHQVDLFGHLDKIKLGLLEAEISRLPEAAEVQATENEKKYLERKTDDTKILDNIAWFYIENLDIRIKNSLG